MAGDSWLSRQLTKAKQNSPVWTEFADAVQLIFDEQVRPVYDRIAGMSSYFTMHPDDLSRRIDEMGKFFYFSDAVEQADLPLAVMQKLDEVHFKRTDLPIQNAISREFKGISVRWMPLYAPKQITPIGSKDYTKKDVNGLIVNSLRTIDDINNNNESLDDYFLTSRGVIEVSSGALSEAGFTTAQFSAMVARVVKPLIPLDIVYDGERIIIHYDILEPKEWLYFTEQTILTEFAPMVEPIPLSSTGSQLFESFLANNIYPAPENPIDRFDRLRLDARPLD